MVVLVPYQYYLMVLFWEYFPHHEICQVKNQADISVNILAILNLFWSFVVFFGFLLLQLRKNHYLVSSIGKCPRLQNISPFVLLVHNSYSFSFVLFHYNFIFLSERLVNLFFVSAAFSLCQESGIIKNLGNLGKISWICQQFFQPFLICQEKVRNSKIHSCSLCLNTKLIRIKCDWYQYGEKSTKYFLNLEKQKVVNGTVKK